MMKPSLMMTFLEYIIVPAFLLCYCFTIKSAIELAFKTEMADEEKRFGHCFKLLFLGFLRNVSLLNLGFAVAFTLTEFLETGRPLESLFGHFLYACYFASMGVIVTLIVFALPVSLVSAWASRRGEKQAKVWGYFSLLLGLTALLMLSS